MKLCVSALAWNQDEEARGCQALASAGVRLIEHVPLRAAGLASRFPEYGLAPIAFQALLFGTSGLELFGTDAAREGLFAQLESVLKIAGELGAAALIFGSPRNRRIDHTRLSEEDAHRIAREFFFQFGIRAAARGCILCLEPNPEAYGCNFLTTTLQTAAFVRSVASPGIRLNLDVGAMSMNRESPAVVWNEVADVVGHVHVSEPRLAAVGASTSTLDTHRELSEVLHKSDYAGPISIEMTRDAADWESALARAIQFVRDVYGAT